MTENTLGPLFSSRKEGELLVPHYTFRSYGSGSSGNCYILTYGGISLVIDVGIGIRRLTKMLREHTEDLSQLRGILVTHCHADHIRGLAPFAYQHDLPIYCSPDVAHQLHYQGRSRRDLSGFVRRMEPHTPIQIGDMQIYAFPVPHDSGVNYGYTISSPAGTFSLITDIGHVTAEIETAVRASNYLIIESNYDDEMLDRGSYPLHLKERIRSGFGHLSNRLSADIVARLWHPQLYFVALCHLSGDNNTPDLALKTYSDSLSRCTQVELCPMSVVQDPIQDYLPPVRSHAVYLSVLLRGAVSPRYILSAPRE